MDELAEKWGVSAWKCYTQWVPDGRGFFLHDEGTGLRRRTEYREYPDPHFLTFGPKSRREFLANLKAALSSTLTREVPGPVSRSPV